ICTKCQSADAHLAEKKCQRLKRGRTLDLVELVSVRNVFQHCLENLSPNGYNPTFSTTQIINPSMVPTFKA
ncbi:hypothetical protein J1N35_014869, partial [Gossypium stocksii]